MTTNTSASRGSTLSMLALTTTLVACGGGGTGSVDDWAGSVSDSAGVTVVANPQEGIWGAAPRWSLIEEYRVGGMDAPTEAQLGQIAPMGLDLDAEGNVYAGDTQAQTVRVYGPDGAFLRTIGLPGQGPGEIGQGMTALFVVGDELWVADMGNLRINRYGLDGSFHEATSLEITQGIPIRWDELAGDRVVVQRRGMDLQGMNAGADGDALVFVDDASDTLAVLPAGQSFQMSGGAPQFRFFEAEPVWDAASDGRLMSAMNSDYRIEVRDPEGALVRVITRDFQRRPVTETDQRQMMTAIRELMIEQGAPPQAVEMIMQQATFAEFYPAFAQLLAGPNGSLWIQRIASAEELGESDDFDLQNLGSDDWDVFDSEGRYLGNVTMPPRFTPIRVDGDAFWGVQRDEFDVQSVVRYRLSETSS